MAIHIHRAERTDRLAVGLCDLLAVPPADPFTPELVAVPTPGIERFLTQTLALRLGTSGRAGRSDGICANVRFPSPAALVDAVLAAGPGGPIRADEDPWRRDRSVWPLLSTIDGSVDEPWCQPLARHLGVGTEADDGWDRSTRRFAVAARLAALFQTYASQRPTLILDWAAGRDTDGAGEPLDPDQAWQAALWQALRARVGQPSPAERLEAACRAVESDAALVDLPARLSIFGASRLPADQLRAVRALAAGRDVHLWLADPSPVLWSRLPDVGPGLTRAADASSAVVRHPLLRSLGRDARELALRLGALDDGIADGSAGGGGSDEHLEPLAGPTQDRTLLARLQADLCADRLPQRDPQHPLDPLDQSIQVHGCHGAGRQVEVLREAILTLLDDDPTLQPRDILVMCPDLTTFAPLLAAAFTATGPGTPLADLRVRIADRSPEQDNEVLTTLGVVLDLVTGRVLRSELLDLVARPPVRTRFRLSDDDVERIEELAVTVGVRWGLDARTRTDFGLAGIDTGTWSWALDRLALGAALSEDGLPVVGGVLPYDDVATNDIALVGTLADVVGQLRRLRDASRQRAPLSTWITLLSDVITALMDARGQDSWQLPHALAALAGLARSLDNHADADPDPGPLLALDDLRWLLADLLAGRPTRSNFRSGGLTVCGLLPMRSVPHRVICLVGLDDGAFPRSPIPDGDDVLARRPCIGERDARSEDRQVLLDAIMAATDHLVVTYTAADDRTNAPSPPCVPLGELLDALDATATLADGRRIREQIMHAHPLQPFDERSFRPDTAWGRPFSHDRAALTAARVARRSRVPRPALTPAEPLPADDATEIELGELIGFLNAPSAWFLRQRIGIRLRRSQELVSESIPVALDGLGAWALGDRIIDLVGRAGHSSEKIERAERARGELPPGQLGTETLQRVGPKAAAVAAAVSEAEGSVPSRLVTVALALPSGRRLVGSIGNLHGATLVRGTYSKADARQIIRAWPRLLAVAAADGSQSYHATLIGNDEAVHLAAPPAADALRILEELAELLVAGTSTPLPLHSRTSHAYAVRRREGKNQDLALTLADRCWRTERFPGESASAEAVAVLGPDAPIATLAAAVPLPGETWWPDEPTRFGQLSRRLWDPILSAVDQGATDQISMRRAEVQP